ncbi:uncharacterized protein LOC122290914 [Carya illinoinensis]|uniref:uncharacterized protein LOC122290914 n=1 Tax=Carya illinoinensis TaxID=32201 RepID=UPI001C7216B7|nr:uncharacterized protein LOC122290914 [Carya illinoinensis]
MEKAYDHINWDFLLYMLSRCGFGERWRKWMRHCMSTARFSVLVNGDPVGFFNNLWGLQQGDSLSPLLFVIIMKALSRMMSAAVEGGFFSRFSVENINISHLLFANDTLLFCEANVGHIQSLKAILLCFEAVSSLKINLAETEMVAVGEVRNIRGLANILGCAVSLLLLKYLGLSLGATFKAKAIWEEVMEKLENRLAG